MGGDRARALHVSAHTRSRVLHTLGVVTALALVTFAIAVCARPEVEAEWAFGAARHWKLCGLAVGLAIGAAVFGAAAPIAGMIALAASQLAAMGC